MSAIAENARLQWSALVRDPVVCFFDFNQISKMKLKNILEMRFK
jgi:hypothetical protein